MASLLLMSTHAVQIQVEVRVMLTGMEKLAQILHFNRCGVCGPHFHFVQDEEEPPSSVIKLSHYRNWFVSTVRAQRWPLTSLMCKQQRRRQHSTRTLYMMLAKA